LISRFAHLPPAYEQALRALGEGPMVDLVHELEGRGEVERLASMDVAGVSDTCGPGSRN
jgi:hypothetical protein